MPRRCTACTHPERDEIDRAIVASESNRNIAKRFELTSASVHRHARAHVPALLRRARDADEMGRADSLLDQLRCLQRRALRILDTAEAADDPATALRALREVRGTIWLIAKMLGDLNETPAVSVSIGFEWPELRGAILAALEPFPDARLAVAEAIGRGSRAN